MRELPVDENYYEKILNNFDQFCDALLERPQLMYRPPKSEEYQSISETLDYLHNTVTSLKNVQKIQLMRGK